MFFWKFSHLHGPVKNDKFYIMWFLFRVNWEESVTETISVKTLDASNNATEMPSFESGSSDQIDSVMQKRHMMIMIYTCIMVIGTICFLFRSFSFFGLCLRISINLHDMIFRGVSRAKMIFFNNNPSGRILNRFANDINNIDSVLPSSMFDVLDVSDESVLDNYDHFEFIDFILTFFLVHDAIYGYYYNNSNHESIAVDTRSSNYSSFLLDACRLCELRT